MAVKRKSGGSKGPRSGAPIIIDGGGRPHSPVTLHFPVNEWTFNPAALTVTSKNAADSVKRIGVKKGASELELTTGSYDKIHIKFA